MALNLTKGQKIDLTKKGDNISNVLVGLGWDPVQQGGGGGFLSKLFGGGSGPDIDCDASVLMLDANGKLAKPNQDVVYYSKLKSPCGSIVHTGDNLTGEGDGDDEQIKVNLSTIPERFEQLVFVVNIYDAVGRRQHFGMVKNCFIHVYDETNRKELVKYQITENNDGRTALIVASLRREAGGWKFEALGDATTDASLTTIVNRYK